MKRSNLKNMKKRIVFLRLSEKLSSKHPRNILPPIHMGYAISIMKKLGYSKIKLIDNRILNYDENKLIKIIVSMKPEILVVSFMTYDYSFSLRVLEKIKKKINNLMIIAVGQHATYSSESLLFKDSPIDVIIRGEYETVLPDVIKNIKKVNVIAKFPYVLCKKCLKKETKINTIENLDSLPFPEHSLFDPEKYVCVYPLPIPKKLRWGHILATRGCPYNCIFCSPTIRESFGKKFRMRSPKNVVDEMEYLVKNFRVNIINFLDDTPTTSKKFIQELSREIIRRGLKIKWIIHGRVDHLDKKTLRLMKLAGCTLIKIGIETTSNRLILLVKKVFKKVNWKKMAEDVLSYSEKIKLPIMGMFLLGIPTETKSEIKNDIQFIMKHRPYILQLAYFTPYPGTPAYEIYKNHVSIIDFNSWFYHYNPKILEKINFSKIPTKTLEKLQSYIYRKFYFSPHFILNQIKTIPYYLLNRHALRGLLYLVFGR